MELRPLENRFDERVLAGTHASGLRVVLVPKQGFARTFGVYTVNFGSIDHRFADVADGRHVELPDGVAHFLEHKMFEDEHGDVTDRFSRFGASTNAFTSFTSTSYLFSTTERATECLELLLDFVLEPHFTPELLAKEQGIIGQEIRMYDDDPSWRIYFGLLQALFREHPVRINIAGTEQSIARIDPELLYSCHRSFYRPDNMVLTLVGNFDPDAVMRTVDEDLAGRRLTRAGPHARAVVHDGPVLSHRTELTLDVARPKLLLGFKERELGGDGRDVERREILSGLALDVMFGRSSPVHEDLFREGLIDDTFGAQYSGETDFGFATIGGDTDEPERLAERLQDAIARFQHEGAAGDDFERARRVVAGRFVGMFNNPESVAYSFAGTAVRGITPFDALEILAGLTVDDMNARVRSLFHAETASQSIVRPRGGA